MNSEEFVDVGCEIELIDSSLYPFSQQELKLYRELDNLAQAVVEDSEIDFEPAEGYEDEKLDPDSAKLGFEFGVQVFALAVFESLVAESRNLDTLEYEEMKRGEIH